MKANETKTLSIPVPIEMAQALETAAESQYRTLASLAREIFANWLRSSRKKKSA